MQQSTKMRAILVAGAALVAAGAFATALGEETVSGGTAPIVSAVGNMTLGGTATTTTPPTAVPNRCSRPEGDCALRIHQGLLITSVYGVGRGTASGNPCGWANQ